MVAEVNEEMNLKLIHRVVTCEGFNQTQRQNKADPECRGNYRNAEKNEFQLCQKYD